MKYNDLETLVGEVLGEPSGTTRYTQSMRQDGIAWSEMQGLKYLPLEDLFNLVYTHTGLVTSAAGLVIHTALPDRIYDVVDLYDSTNDIHIERMEYRDLALGANKNVQYGHYWYYVSSTDDGVGGAAAGEGAQIQVKFPTGYDVTQVDTITYKVYPSSYAYDGATGTFGAVEMPFEGNEELIAVGAAAHILLKEGDSRWEKLMAVFERGLGVESLVARHDNK